MDFVSLADGSERLVRAAARHLAASPSGYDDDGVTPAATATAAAPLSPEAMPAPSPYSGAGGLAGWKRPRLFFSFFQDIDMVSWSTPLERSFYT